MAMNYCVSVQRLTDQWANKQLDRQRDGQETDTNLSVRLVKEGICFTISETVSQSLSRLFDKSIAMTSVGNIQVTGGVLDTDLRMPYLGTEIQLLHHNC